MKTLFVYNPNAGMMQIKNHLYDILNTFAKADFDLTVVPTKASGEATKCVKKNCGNYDLVICSGGDGTLNEVVNGLLTSNSEKLPILGYIPAGSTNDYATSLKIPKDMKKAAELITKCQPIAYDMGKFNSKYFIYVAAFGAFTSVTYSTPQETKNMIGHLAYIFEGIKSLTSIKSYKLKISSEDIKIEGKFIFGMISNTYSVGGIYKFDRKTVKLDDGQLEVMLVREPKNPIELAEINSYLVNSKTRTDMVISFKTDKITISTDDDMPWTLDGEYGGNPKKITITNINKAVKIISKE